MEEVICGAPVREGLLVGVLSTLCFFCSFMFLACCWWRNSFIRKCI